MLHPKACPRCRGDLTLVHDVDDSYFSCVQCGFVSYGWPETLRPQVLARAR
jgi:Zn ribbon nucleic-acid-binding protein